MAQYRARIAWQRDGAVFLDRRYSREHRWTFDGGINVRASASPHIVSPPLSVEQAVDPEEAFVASLSSCHMLWFLDIAAKRKFAIDSYVDDAVGVMEKNAEGRLAITRVTLRPAVHFSGDRLPSREELDDMHHRAHEACFIANSVKTEVLCEPVAAPAD